MENTVLCTRTYKFNCGKLTAYRFIDDMMMDLISAKSRYDAINYPIQEQRHQDRIKSLEQSTYNHAVKYAEKRWKTERRRKQYVEEEMKKLKTSAFKYRSITFFDFDVEPWSNGISNDCILSYDKLDKDALLRCFNRIRDNKYFKNAIGWKLVDHQYSRPQIELILPEDLRKEFDNDSKTLGEAISNFYSNSNYWGD